MSEIQIEKIKKTFDDFVAVEESDLTINNGEFFVLLGPSGCGKTTTTNVIVHLLMAMNKKIILDQHPIKLVH